MATTPALGRNFPTLRYATAPIRWAVRTPRRRRTLAAVLLAMFAAPIVWWPIQLMGLPDIGDPADLDAFRFTTIPDSRNAYVLYAQAVERLKPLPRHYGAFSGPPYQFIPWPQVAPTLRRWLEENGPAMALYREGSNRPDAIPEASSAGIHVGTLGELHGLALLEASRLEEQGKMEEAWAWYRASLRAIHHLGRHARLHARDWPQRWWYGQILGRVATWASDPRTTPALIRRALDDVLACEAMAPSEAYTIAMEYPTLLGTVESISGPDRRGMAPWIVSIGPIQAGLSPEQVRALVDAWRWWRREPERSRRVVRLAVANWLAYEQSPPDRRPPPDPDVSGPFDFYALGPDAPANARVLSPAALDRWLASTTDAQDVLRAFDFRGIRIRERANHRAMVVLLASQLYRRDHGSDPPDEAALVGPYLKSLPDDSLDDSNPEQAPQE
jgi:hypothetical protein